MWEELLQARVTVHVPSNDLPNSGVLPHQYSAACHRLENFMMRISALKLMCQHILLTHMLQCRLIL